MGRKWLRVLPLLVLALLLLGALLLAVLPEPIYIPV